MAIMFNMDPLEETTPFPYLIRTVTFNNISWAALYRKLQKSQRQWGMVETVLR